MSNMGDMSHSDSAIEEMCTMHQDIYVAFSKKLQRLVCNQCIYSENSDVNSNDIGDPLEMDFTSFVAQELKELFDQKFDLYKKSLEDMKEIAPTTISK